MFLDAQAASMTAPALSWSTVSSMYGLVKATAPAKFSFITCSAGVSVGVGAGAGEGDKIARVSAWAVSAGADWARPNHDAPTTMAPAMSAAPARITMATCFVVIFPGTFLHRRP